MTRSLRQHLTTILVAMFTATMMAGGPAIAAAFDAMNADKVDGRHAVGPDASLDKRAGKLVATDSGGRLPNNIIVKARDAEKIDGMDSDELQQRVSAACPAGSAMRSVQADGGVSCVETQLTNITQLNGLTCSTPDGPGTITVVTGPRSSSSGGYWTYPTSIRCRVPWPADGTACSDGDPGTTDDVWSNGDCTGTPPNCDDGNPYSNDYYMPGGCAHDVNAYDSDQDGFTAEQPKGGAPDCDDTDPTVSPDAPEVAGNDVDDDCDGTVDET